METIKLFYDEGPLRIVCGEAGMFQLGIPKEVPMYLANVLLKKGIVKEWSSIEGKKEGKIK